eukprot:11085688-Lingulodinium_polyedra.AAC.1
MQSILAWANRVYNPDQTGAICNGAWYTAKQTNAVDTSLTFYCALDEEWSPLSPRPDWNAMCTRRT